MPRVQRVDASWRQGLVEGIVDPSGSVVARRVKPDEEWRRKAYELAWFARFYAVRGADPDAIRRINEAHALLVSRASDGAGGPSPIFERRRLALQVVTERAEALEASLSEPLRRNKARAELDALLEALSTRTGCDKFLDVTVDGLLLVTRGKFRAVGVGRYVRGPLWLAALLIVRARAFACGRSKGETEKQTIDRCVDWLREDQKTQRKRGG